jgi:hypothetical protein
MKGCPNPNCGFDLDAHNERDLQYCSTAATLILLREIRDLLAVRDDEHEQPRDPRLVVRVPPKRGAQHAA